VPIHVIWDAKKKVKIQIFFPEDLMNLIEIYNVKEEDIVISKGVIEITDFEKNGYLGMLFKTEVVETPEVIRTFRVVLIDSKTNLKNEISQDILFFRPHIIVPEGRFHKMVIELKKSSFPRISKRMKIDNVGLGTAIISLSALEESDVKITEPKELSEYIQKFYNVFKEEIDHLKREFPQYRNLLEEYLKISDTLYRTYELDEKIIEELKKINEGLWEAFKQNPKFLERFAEAFLIAFLSSLHLVMELQSFLNYIKSIAKKGIILYNAMHTLKLRPGLNKFRGRIVVTDLAFNKYTPIDVEIDIEVKAETEIFVPIYHLFEWGEGSECLTHKV